MDALQLKAIIEQILINIFSHGPNAIHQLIVILQIIAKGAVSLGAISTVIIKSPALIEVINHLLELIKSGAGIPEIASALVELATTLGITSDALIHLLQLIASFLL